MRFRTEQLVVSSARNASKLLVDGEILPYLGHDIHLIVEIGEKPVPNICLDEGRLVLSVPNTLPNDEHSDLTRNAVLSWYRERAQELLPARVDRWLARTVYYQPVKYPYCDLMLGELLPWAVDEYLPRLGHASKPRVLIGSQKTIWGSCGYDGTIRLNWRSVMLEPSLVDYLVVHELTHLYVSKHSDAFWELASSILPDAQGLHWRLREAERSLLWWHIRSCGCCCCRSGYWVSRSAACWRLSGGPLLCPLASSRGRTVGAGRSLSPAGRRRCGRFLKGAEARMRWQPCSVQIGRRPSAKSQLTQRGRIV